MTTEEQLVEQHIREYQSRRKHLDELLDRAHDASKHLGADNYLKTELKDLQGQQADLVDQTEKLQKMSLDHWREEMIQSAGPIMAVWDVLAQKIEDLIEKAEK